MLRQTDSDDESRDATPKSPVEGKTNIDVSTKPVTASIEAREREEEMSPTNLGANLSVDENVKVAIYNEKKCPTFHL